MERNRYKLASWLSVLVVAGIVLATTTLTGCGTSCSQDYPPPTQITTDANPYRMSHLSSNLDYVSARWKNITTGESGTGLVTQVSECVFPIGCYLWTKFEYSIPLTTGLNTIYTYEKDGGCEWRDDYLITFG